MKPNAKWCCSGKSPSPRELVWTAMTVPEHQNRWWGPDGFINENVTMDFRLGGAWTFDMVGPDGTRYPNHSVFTQITPPSKLVFDHGDGQRVWFESTITLEASPSGTLIALRHVSPPRNPATRWSKSMVRSRVANSTSPSWKRISGRTCPEQRGQPLAHHAFAQWARCAGRNRPARHSTSACCSNQGRHAAHWWDETHILDS